MNIARYPLASASVALALAALTAPVAMAANDSFGTAAPAQAGPVAQAQALRVVRDKETGKLRAPTEDELASMNESERAARKARGEAEPTGPGAPLALRQYPNGMHSAVLGPDYLINLKAQRGADGKLVVSHTNPANQHPTAPSQRPTE